MTMPHETRHCRQVPSNEEDLDLNLREDCVKEVTSEPRPAEGIGAGNQSNSKIKNMLLLLEKKQTLQI